jgi:DNA-directed RNA polymerase specialized sigma subunit
MLRPKKKKLNNPDWDEEIRKLDEATQLKDSWRYVSVGEDVWKIDNNYYYDPTDEMIERIDNKNKIDEGECLVEKMNLPAGVEMIERLTPVKQKVVFYYVWEGMSFSKIGKVLGFSKQRSHQIYWAAIQDLKEIFGGDNVLYGLLDKEEE